MTKRISAHEGAPLIQWWGLWEIAGKSQRTGVTAKDQKDARAMLARLSPCAVNIELYDELGRIVAIRHAGTIGWRSCKKLGKTIDVYKPSTWNNFPDAPPPCDVWMRFETPEGIGHRTRFDGRHWVGPFNNILMISSGKYRPWE